MDRWAVHYGARAAFVCVGCAGPGLASQFTKELKLSKCTVAYASQGSGPKWGQLGCSGFIVLDANLRVVCDATSPFLELREPGPEGTRGKPDHSSRRCAGTVHLRWS